MFDHKTDNHVHSNGVISVPKVHMPSMEDFQKDLRSFPQPYPNQPPSIDILISTVDAKPISFDQVEDLVGRFVGRQRQRQMDKANFGALRDERDLYKTHYVDNTKIKENLRHEISQLKEQSFALNQTQAEKEKVIRVLQDKSHRYQEAERNESIYKNKISEAEQKNRLLKEKLNEKMRAQRQQNGGPGPIDYVYSQNSDLGESIPFSNPLQRPAAPQNRPSPQYNQGPQTRPGYNPPPPGPNNQRPPNQQGFRPPPPNTINNGGGQNGHQENEFNDFLKTYNSSQNNGDDPLFKQGYQPPSSNNFMDESNEWEQAQQSYIPPQKIAMAKAIQPVGNQPSNGQGHQNPYQNRPPQQSPGGRPNPLMMKPQF